MQLKRYLVAFIVLLGAAATACGSAGERAGEPDKSGKLPMDHIAEQYVRLILAVGQHDPDYVDAYYGPPEWKPSGDKVGLDLLAREAASLTEQVAKVTPAGDEIEQLRHRYLKAMLSSVSARLRMLQGDRPSFDDESRTLYDATAPVLPESHFQEVLTSLDAHFPGSGPLIDRYEAWRKSFVVPTPKLDHVFRTAIAACRERTTRQIPLPAGETFTVEYVTGKSWSGYNWYQGGFTSLIQVNTDLPVYVDRAVDLACHEGYPGHHVYNVLLEKHLVRDRGWTEFTVYPLFSPQSLIAEGTANYGIEVAFPGSERLAFEEAVLFPAAGLDPATARRYYEVQALVERLSYAGNEAARRYINREIDARQAAAWLQQYALMSPERAQQRVRFFDQYRSYVINYNLGKDMVREFIEGRVSQRKDPRGADAVRWEEFGRLLSSPRLPSSLR